MQTKRILSAFAFTLLTIFLLLVVASRSGEAAKAEEYHNVDADIGQGMPEPTTPGVMPGGKEETDPKDAEKPDIDITSWEYILAGPSNNIGKYTPYVVAIEDTAQYFDERAITPLVNFLNAARDAGFTPYIQTAYRSYSSQEYLLNGRASQIAWPEYPTAEDYAEAEKYVAPPGESDHQTGLGADIVDQYYSSLSVDTVNARFLTWLADNCADYGFVIRYPSDKVSITGRNEPWHVRYVGDAAARFMTEHNLCLEEFVALYQ